MTYHEAKQLKLKNRVTIWIGTEQACAGTIVEAGYNAVKIQWDDGVVGVIHLRDMLNVTHA